MNYSVNKVQVSYFVELPLSNSPDYTNSLNFLRLRPNSPTFPGFKTFQKSGNPVSTTGSQFRAIFSGCGLEMLSFSIFGRPVGTARTTVDVVDLVGSRRHAADQANRLVAEAGEQLWTLRLRTEHLNSDAKLVEYLPASTRQYVTIVSHPANTVCPPLSLQRLIDWLRFNGIFSTNRLYRSFDKHVSVKEVKLMRKLTMLSVGNTYKKPLQ